MKPVFMAKQWQPFSISLQKMRNLSSYSTSKNWVECESTCGPRTETHERRKSTTKVAASKQFVEIQELLHWNEGIDGKMRVAAIAYEFAFGTRVGNIGWDSKSKGKHMLKAEDVEFWLRGPDDGHSYHSFELGLQQVSSEDCFRIVLVHVSGKNFGGKKGPLTNVLDRKVSPDKDGKLIDMLFEFAIGAQHQRGDFFFSRNMRGLNKKFTSHDSGAAVKESAEHLGLPPSVFSTTSWRAGSATALSAAGMSDEFLKRTKKWFGDASLLYQRRYQC